MLRIIYADIFVSRNFFGEGLLAVNCWGFLYPADRRMIADHVSVGFEEGGN